MPSISRKRLVNSATWGEPPRKAMGRAQTFYLRNLLSHSQIPTAMSKNILHFYFKIDPPLEEELEVPKKLILAQIAFIHCAHERGIFCTKVQYD